MQASLPMYDWPEVREATDAWWAGLARYAGLETRLERRSEIASLWRKEGFAFSQTCGYPFTHEFRGKLRYVATPHYAVGGCAGPLYSSFIMARDLQPLEAFRGKTAVINTPDSLSGMLALKLVFAPLSRQGHFFGQAWFSGSHAASLAAVQKGEADICASDAVCIALARRYRPSLLEGLVAIAQSQKLPALPYVTGEADGRRWQSTLAQAFADPDLKPVREALLLQGYSVLQPGAYDVILDLEQQVEANRIWPGSPAAVKSRLL